MIIGGVVMASFDHPPWKLRPWQQSSLVPVWQLGLVSQKLWYEREKPACRTWVTWTRAKKVTRCLHHNHFVTWQLLTHTHNHTVQPYAPDIACDSHEMDSLCFPFLTFDIWIRINMLKRIKNKRIVWLIYTRQLEFDFCISLVDTVHSLLHIFFGEVEQLRVHCLAQGCWRLSVCLEASLSHCSIPVFSPLFQIVNNIMQSWLVTQRRHTSCHYSVQLLLIPATTLY